MWPDLERRSVIELRAESSRLVGYAVVFNVRSRDLGGFVEVVKPQAVSTTEPVVALFNHDSNQVLGRTPATLQLRTDDRGLAFVLDPAPTQAGRDALALVQRGDVTGASMGFRTKKDTWRNEAGLMVRELLDIEIAEISLTAFPAYRETDVSIARRSLDQFQAKTPMGVFPKVTSIQWCRLREKAR
jgi:HK97 family phage prohead protease